MDDLKNEKRRYGVPDDENPELTEESIRRSIPAKQFFAERGLPMPGRPIIRTRSPGSSGQGIGPRLADPHERGACRKPQIQEIRLGRLQPPRATTIPACDTFAAFESLPQALRGALGLC